MAAIALLDAIREAAIDPAAWDRVQRESETYFGAFASSLARADHRNGNALLSRTTEVPEIDEAVREIAPFSEAVLYTAAMPRWRRLSDYDYIDEAGMDRSLFYRECERFDVRYRLGLRLLDSPGVSQLILWFWPAAHGHAGPEEYAKLRLIEQELRLAAHVSDHLSQSFEVERGIVEALETMATPALVVEPNGTAVVMNGGAESTLSQHDGLTLDGGRRLRADNKAAAGRLADELANAGNAALLNRTQRCPCAVAIPRPSGRPAYGVLVTPLSIRHQFLGQARALVLVILNDPAERPPPQTAVLREAFGLTSAETDVALLFTEGHSLREIADHRRVTLGTIQNQIKALMSKTGASRQAEMMRMLQAYGGYVSDDPQAR